MVRLRHLNVLIVRVLMTCPGWERVAAASVDDKTAVETTVCGMEEAVQAYDFKKQDSLLAPGARWIERSLPLPAAYDGTGFFVQTQAAKVRLSNRPARFRYSYSG